MNIRLNMTQSSSLKTIKCRCCGNEISAVNTQLDCNDLLGLLKSTNEFIHMPCRCSNCGCVTLWENLTYDETTKDLLKSPEYTKYLYSMTYDEAFKNWVLLFNIIKHNHFTIHAIVCKIKAYDYIEQIYPDTKVFFCRVHIERSLMKYFKKDHSIMKMFYLMINMKLSEKNTIIF